jgi:malate synthase
MTGYVSVGSINVGQQLFDFIETETLPGAGIASTAFWNGFGRIAAEFAPRNRALLARRDALQTRIDAWHQARAGQPHDPDAYKFSSSRSAIWSPRVPISASTPRMSILNFPPSPGRNSWRR